MNRRITGFTVAMVFAFGAAALEGQLMTERYIPLGQSPGVSGVLTFVGQIQSVDTEAGTCIVANENETRTIELTDETWIWLDRSTLRQANTTGTAGDLRPGVTVEVKFQNGEIRERADWVKVAVAGG